MEQKVWKDMKKETIQEKKVMGEGQGMNSKSTGLEHWWKQNYVYVISSLLILVIMLIVLAYKRFWPFGTSVFVGGDFILQGWPYIAELKEKLINSESLLYTWNAGFGTNYYSIMAYGLLNPVTWLYLLVPVKAIIRISTFVYILTLMLCNGTMLFFLTHRPVHALPKRDMANMLFSMSYALCIYMVSNINNWTFLVCAIFFPLILLGLENFVANKGWKLYFITLAIAFISNYYFTGLFCIFIILYYLTLEFENIKVFFKKSLKIFGISSAAILLSSILMVPAAIQMTGQSYTVSSYVEGTWFTTFFDIIKNFFAFNSVIDKGTAVDSYGEVNLYFGLMPLLFATFYFLNPKIKRVVRLKKLCLTLLYLIAFNLNGLNYVMHLMHYPTWFPNRFSLFFILFCIILAYESWVSMESTDYKYVTVSRGVVVGLSWTLVAILCVAFAKHIEYTFTYSYSVMILLIYMAAILLLPYLKGKEARVLALVGCIELCVNSVYLHLSKDAYTLLDVPSTEIERMIVDLEDFLEEAPVHKENGFFRVLEGKNSVINMNGGMLNNFKGTSLFSSSMGNQRRFLGCMGVDENANTISPYTYTPATLSLLNIRYIFQDPSLGGDYLYMPDELYTSATDVMAQYESVHQQGDYVLCENPTFLSLGYMIDRDADALFSESFETGYEQEGAIGRFLNEWVEGVSGVPDVIEPVPLQLTSIAVRNGDAVVSGNRFYISNGLKEFEIQDIDWNAPDVFQAVNQDNYIPTDTSDIRFDGIVEEEGDYFVEILGSLAPLGHLDAGGEIHVYYEMKPKYLVDNGMANSTIHIYRFNEEQWQKAYDILSQQQLQVEAHDSTSVDGIIQVKEEGILFISIPYDENWHLYIDGEETEILPLWEETFIATKLGPGEHTIQLKYKQRGLLIGGLLSVLALGFTVFAFLSGKKRDFLLEQEMSDEHLETFCSEEILERRKKQKKLETDQEPSEEEIHSQQ